MKAIAAALLVATLAGCAVVPLGPPIYVGVSARGGFDHGGGYRGGYRGGYHDGYHDGDRGGYDGRRGWR